MPREKKYLLRDSDRSGFTYKKIELVRDKGSLVGGDEFDTPPPSDKPTGGEGVYLNPDARQNAMTSYAATNSRVTQSVGVSGVTFIQGDDSQDHFDINDQWIYVSGLSSRTFVTSNPQVSRGYSNAIFTIQCVSNNIILVNGSGLSLQRTFNMDSGSILVMIYNSTDNLWHELSRSHVSGRYVYG